MGLVYGLTLTLLNEMLIFAGQIIGLQFSFSPVNLLDPASAIQTPLLGELFQSGVSGALNQTGTLALDAGAALTLVGTAAIGGLLEIGGGSKLTAGAVAFAATGSAAVLAYGGSSAQFGTVATNIGAYYGPSYGSAVIGVDATSSIEIGTAGGAANGALTVDSGVTVNLLGTIDGNLVLNGTLVVADGTLAIGSFGTAAPTISGGGTIDLDWGDTLSLGGSDTAAIVFNGTYTANGYSSTSETLSLAGALPAGRISGFAAGDVITVAKPVTGLSYVQNGAGDTDAFECRCECRHDCALRHLFRRPVPD